MTNPYFNHTNRFEAHTLSRAENLNNAFDGVVAGFDALPTPTQLKLDTANFAVATGSSNAYVVTLPYVPSALTAGMTLRFQANHANTGPATVNVNSLGAVAIRRYDGAALEAGDIPSGAIVQISYDATNTYFRMVGGGGTASGGGDTEVSIGDVEGLQAYLDLIEELPIITSRQLELTGATTDVDLLNTSFVATAAAGVGARYMLEAYWASGYFSFAERLEVKSYCHVDFLSEVRCAKRGRIAIMGDIEEEPETGKPTLSGDVSIGDTVLPITIGATPITSLFAVGDRIIIRGKLDGDRNPYERQETRVTAVNAAPTNTIEVADQLEYDFKSTYPLGDYETNFGVANRTRIATKVVAELTGNPAVGDVTLSVNNAKLGSFSVGDYVLVTDSKRSLDIAGTSDNRIHVEVAQIRAKGTGTVTLSHGLVNPITTTWDGRIEKINPAVWASVSGARVRFTEAPDASPAPRVHTFEMHRAAHCFFRDCSVPGLDSFGSRGNAFRFYECLDCERVNCYAGPTLYSGSGDGYGGSNYYSTGCRSINLRTERRRHGELLQGCNLFMVLGYQSKDDGSSALDGHGLNERFGLIDGFLIVGGDFQATDTTTKQGVRLGNPSHLGGCYGIVVRNGRVQNYLDGTGDGLRVYPGAYTDRLVFEDIDVDRADYGIRMTQNTTYPTLLSSGVAFARIRAYQCGRAIDVRGDEAVSGTKAVVDLRLIDVEGIACGDYARIDDCNGILIQRPDYTVIGSGGSQSYAMDLRQDDGLVIVGGHLANTPRGIRLEDCADHVVAQVHFGAFTDPSPLALMDAGENETFQWLGNTFQSRSVSLSANHEGTVIDLWTPVTSAQVTRTATALLPGATVEAALAQLEIEMSRSALARRAMSLSTFIAQR